MKKVICLVLSLLFLLSLSSCSEEGKTKSANAVFSEVKSEKELLLRAVSEMEAFGEERIYVALEAEKAEEEEDSSAEALPETGAEKRLVSFITEGGDREEIENALLQEVLEKFGLEVIFFQTSSDARRCVIFSYSREKEHKGLQNGFYYSFDSLPCAWWGREAKLKKDKNRFVQSNTDGSAWYMTQIIESGFYYFEKQGNLIA